MQIDLSRDTPTQLVAGLFAGIGGIERGLRRAGYESVFFSEIDPHAQAVLRRHFPTARLQPDVRAVRRLPEVDVIAAGFPCQDLSVAGKRAGIGGEQSGLVSELFRLLSTPSAYAARWLLVENVPYMLGLDQGRAMRHLTKELETLGFMWAYRVIDVRSFGLPQRRPRVYLVASRTEDPRQVLFADDFGIAPTIDATEPTPGMDYGFYWTEGLRGVGWCGNSVPPIKTGSGLGIPSPPAVWFSETGEIGTIDLRDAERLQGFPVNWTLPAETVDGAKRAVRWRLIGNAVCSVVPEWLGKRMRKPGTVVTAFQPWTAKGSWPRSAWGYNGHVFKVDASMYPLKRRLQPIAQFLRYPLKPLSEKATRGYLNRARRCWWYISPKFIAAVENHLLTQVTPESVESKNPSRAA